MNKVHVLLTRAGVPAAEHDAWIRERGENPFTMIRELEGVRPAPPPVTENDALPEGVSVHKDPCRTCGGTVIYMFQQVRAADEGMTGLFRCTKCNRRWKE